MEVGDFEHGSGPVEERDVRPERLERRPPAQPHGVLMRAEELRSLPLGHRTVVRRYPRRLETFVREDARIVQIDQLRFPRELNRRERDISPEAHELIGSELATPEASEALHDRRQGLLRDVEATVRQRVVVTAGALKHARKPKRTATCSRLRLPVPGEAAEQDHAKESACSCRMAASSSSTLPCRMTSIGRRFRRSGLSPKSQSSIVSGWYMRRSADI